MPSNAHQQGDLLQADFLDNVGGINVTDSPFKVQDSQCLESYNFDYAATGGIRKRKGMGALMASADTQLMTIGLSQYVTPASVKTLIRAAGTKIQSLDSTTYAPTNLTEDTAAAASNFLTSSTQPVVFSQFNTAAADPVTGTGNTLWMAGGGLAAISGVASTSKVTQNGASIPTGSVGLSASGAGSSLSTGTYWYAISKYKGITQVTSNAALDGSVAVTAGQNVVLDLSTVVNSDSTKYTQLWIYRSAVAGVTGFTAGAIIAKVAAGTTTYTDTGTSIVTPTVIPRAANTLLDNSVLPTATYTCVTTFKRRLVTATGSTLYLSDLNKPESWPTGNTINIPSGDKITALAVLYFANPSTASNDEYLVIFKASEMWLLTGDALTVDNSNPGNAWKLKFLDYVGSPAQATIINGNGFIAWINSRGIFTYDGSGKPSYCSRLIENLFQDDGDLNKAYLSQGFGVYYKKYNQMIWFMSHNVKGVQRFMIKMDLRLTVPLIQNTLIATNRIIEAAFTFDYQAIAGIYAGSSFIGPAEIDENVYIGDDAGQIYKMYYGYQDSSSSTLDFNYKTKFLDLGTPGVAKRIHKVIVYAQNLGNFTLSMNYWADYRTQVTNASQKQSVIPVYPAVSGTPALWDVGFWDQALWDDFFSTVVPLTFNLSSEGNNAEGDCIQLQFTQTSSNSPIFIYGFSIIYSLLGTRH